MSDESNDGFLDHLFNAIGHLSRASKQRAAQQETERAERAGKKRKLKTSFDEAPAATPPASDCCIAKR